MSDYKLALFTKDDFNAYQRLVNSNPDAPVNPETQARRKWWCFDNPHGGAFAVALSGDRVAATCYLAGKSLVLGGTAYKAYEIGETGTAPEHQRKGLFSKLVRLCTAHAFDQGAQAVYGTPNAQSTPGYAKLGFDIIDDRRSHFLMSPNLTALALPDKRHPAPGVHLAPRGRGPSYRIDSAAFFAQARHRARINDFSQAYFQWRFLGLDPRRYAFFKHGDFSMATREYQLGRHRLLMVSDFGHDHAKLDAFKAISQIRHVYSHEFRARQYAGIYLNTEWASELGHWRHGLKRLVYHRSLPLCVMTNGAPRFAADLRHAGLPQLSDCDIG